MTIFIGTYKGSDYKDYITARTNRVQFIKELFPNKIVKEFDLVKSKIEAETMLTPLLLFSASRS
jgi:hypothetical protein